jgi:diguanylate cyclase (GGDEF)-like protein
MVLLGSVALVPVAILAISSIVLSSNQVTSVVDKRVQTTAAVSSVVVGQQTTNLVALVHSYATRPALAEGVAAGDVGQLEIESNLASLTQAVPGISSSFVTDIHGTLRDVYPLEPSVIGGNFAYREWFTGLLESGRPYVSSAIETREAGHALAVTVTDYIRGPDGRPIGVLAVNYTLDSIRTFAGNVGRAQGITLEVTDRLGTSLTAGGANGLVSLAADPRVRDALDGHSGLLHYAPLLPNGRRGPEELSAYAPVAGTGWTVVASIPQSSAFAGLVRLRITVLGITAVLVIILLAGIVSLHRRLAEQRTQLEGLNLELTSLARRDPLTGVGNRRLLQDDLEVLEARVARHGHAYCMALLDVDHFKSYNDTSGHQAGDDVLRTVATELKHQGRGGDMLYRYGGEEFLYILPAQTLASGIAAAERMRRSVEHLAIPHDRNQAGVVTISAGVAMLDPDNIRSAGEVLRDADQALYRAKELGRNRVEGAASDDEPQEKRTTGLEPATFGLGSQRSTD